MQLQLTLALHDLPPALYCNQTQFRGGWGEEGGGEGQSSLEREGQGRRMGWRKSIRCQPLEAEARRAYHEGLGVAKEQR